MDDDAQRYIARGGDDDDRLPAVKVGDGAEDEAPQHDPDEVDGAGHVRHPPLAAHQVPLGRADMRGCTCDSWVSD